MPQKYNATSLNQKFLKGSLAFLLASGLLLTLFVLNMGQSQAAIDKTAHNLDFRLIPKFQTGAPLVPTQNEVKIQPGTSLTLTYILTNTTGASTTFTIALPTFSPLLIQLITPTKSYAFALANGESRPILVNVTAKNTAPLNAVVLLTVTANYGNLKSTGVSTLTIQATKGTRYVTAAGNDTDNNCTQTATPCKTIKYAFSQATTDDEVRLAQGTYKEADISVNNNLRGGYDTKFTKTVNDPSKTIIDAAQLGRVLLIQAGQHTVENLTVKGGATSGAGGAIYVWLSASPVLTNLIVLSSTANLGGGGIAIETDGQPILQKVAISNTHSLEKGGGIYISKGKITLNGLTIFAATADQQGGALYNEQGQLTLTNNFIYGNTSANSDGGAIYNNGGTLSLINNSFYGNSAPKGKGGTVYFNAGTALTFINNIVANSTATVGGGTYFVLPATKNIDYNNYWNNSTNSNVSLGAHDLAVNPLFVDETGYNYHILISSPMIDQGATPAIPLTSDIDGNVRPSDQNYDIGADEVSSCLVRNKRIPTAVEGVVQKVVDAASKGDTIQIAGQCRGVQTKNGLTQAVYVDKNLTLEGGFNATFAKNKGLYTTTLDALGLGRVVVITGGATVNLTVNLLDVVLTGGKDTDAGGGLYVYRSTVAIDGGNIKNSQAAKGSGIYNDHGTINLGTKATTPYKAEDITLLGTNQATHGGGLYNDGGAVTLKYLRIYTNTADLAGGVYNNGGVIKTQSGFIATGNSATTNGGGFYNSNGGQLSLDSSYVVNNKAVNGGGVYQPAGALTNTLVASNTIVANNTATGNGGGYFNGSPKFTVRHNTIYANSANLGGGIYDESSGQGAIVNSTILMNNTATGGGGIYCSQTACPVAFNYNDLYQNSGGDAGGTISASSGTGNIGVDPIFNSTAMDTADYLRIISGSPVEDKGDLNSPLKVDIDGIVRPSNQTYDIGVSEAGGCFVRLNGAVPTYGNIQTVIGLSTKSTDQIRVAGICRGVNTLTIEGQLFKQVMYLTKSLTIKGGFTEKNWTTSDMLKNPTIIDAASMGRLVYITGSAVVSISDLDLRGGFADIGGGVLVQSGTLTLAHNSIYSNTATQGGVMYNNGGRLFAQGNDLRNNNGTSGAVIYHAKGQSWIQNNVIRQNSATDGGAVYNEGEGLYVWHNAFYLNNATGNGSGLYIQSGKPDVRNNIFFNQGGANVLYSIVPITIAYNDVFNATAPMPTYYGGSAAAGEGALNVDPMFINVADDTKFLEGFRLDSSSTLVDAGDPTMPLKIDFEGNLRPGQQGYDMGIDETTGCSARIMRDNKPERIYGSIQAALNSSVKGDVIQVTAQECKGVHALDFNGQTIWQTVHITHSVTLMGGFDSNFSKSPDGSTTTINPEGNGRGMVILNASDIVVSKFKLIQGDAISMSGLGGGLYYAGTANVLITGSTFLSNTAENGAAIYDAGQGLRLVNNSLSNNTATNGTIYNNGDNTMSLEGNIIFNNRTQNGAGFYHHQGTAWLDLGNRFEANVATDNGGGIYDNNGNLHIWNSILYRNQAKLGAGVYLAKGSAEVLYNTFHANEAVSQGGAIFIASNAITPTIMNNIFSAQKAPSAGGSAIYGTKAIEDYNNYYQNVQPELAGLSKGEHDLSLDPKYVSLGSNSDFHLQSVSRLIDQGNNLDQGNNTFKVARDFEGTPRPVNRASDMGADEYSACLAKLVRTGKLYGQINAALRDAQAGDEILLAIGTCEENVVIRKDLKNISIRGGWPEIFYPQPAGMTTIDALGNGRVVTIEALDYARLSNVRLINGVTTGNGGGLSSNATQLVLGYVDGDKIVGFVEVVSNTAQLGGGIYIATSSTGSAILNNVDVQANHATGDGGGVYSENSSNVIFWGGYVGRNIADNNGGGLYNQTNSTVQLTGGLEVEFNKAAKDGGGVYINGSTFDLSQKRIIGNEAGQNGGGLYITNDSKVNLVNLGLSGNTAINGAGMYRDAPSGTVNVQHSTIQYNYAKNQGGAIYNSGSQMNVNASIIASNIATATTSGGIYATDTGKVALAYSLRWDNEYVGSVVTTTGNIENQNPLIREIGGDLYKDSPAIDAVPNTATTITLDRFFDRRPIICAKDMGRDEFRVFRKLTWGNPDMSQQTVASAKSALYTYKLSNDSQNLTGPNPPTTYSAANGLGIGTGYTETVTVNVNSSRGWATLVGNIDLGILDGNTQATFDLQSGQAITLQIKVTVPPGSVASVETDTTTLDQATLTAVGKYWYRYGKPEVTDPTHSCETLTGEDKDTSTTSRIVTTKVLGDFDFDIAPENFGYAMPGETITYTHIVTNNGNAKNTFQLVAKPGFYARAEVIPTQITLDPGQSATVLLKVTINEQSAKDLVDRSGVIVRYTPKTGPVLEVTAFNSTQILPTSGSRHVYFEGGRDSLVTESELDPNLLDELDNNCTLPRIAPCKTLEQALEQAAEGDVIKIAAGTYSRTLTIQKSVTLKGGYDNTDWTAEPPDHLNNPTIFDPKQTSGGRAIYIVPGVDVTLDHLFILNGSVIGATEGGQNVGGNILSDGHSLTIRNSRIYNGKATTGGGVYSKGKLVVQNSLFHDNTTTNQGGAIYQEGTDSSIQNSNFYQNAANQGGAIYLASPASYYLASNIFAKNGNKAISAPAGQADYNLYFNDTLDGGIANGAHDVQADPKFKDLTTFPPDLSIATDSPAVDKGDPSTNTGLMPYDYANNPRRSGATARIDIGAYEIYVEPMFKFSPDTVNTFPIGSQRSLIHVLENSGDVADTYTLQFSSSRGWSSLGQTSVSLAPGQSKDIFVSLTIPADGLDKTDVTVITVTSQAHPEAIGLAVDTTTGGRAVPSEITFTGPTIGRTKETYNFTAKVSPDLVNLPLTFTWQVDGGTPIVHHISSLTDTVELTWATQGRKVLTLIAENQDGKVKATYTININDTIASQSPTKVEIVGATTGLINTAYTFKATTLPATAVQPLIYQWQADGQTMLVHTNKGLNDEVTFTWSKTGVYLITLLVSNSAGSKSQTFEVRITDAVEPPLMVGITGATAGLINQNYAFVAHTGPLTTTQPLTYTWQADGQASQVHTNGIINDTAVFNWTTEGTHYVTVTVQNQAGQQSSSYQILMTRVASPPQSVVIIGPTLGALDTEYNFSAQVSLNTTTQPLTYTWQATDQTAVIQTDNLSDTVSFTWNTLGKKVVTVIAENGAGRVATSRTITIKASAIPQPPKTIKISGATAGLVNSSYTFKAEVSPSIADQPLTYYWTVEGQSEPTTHQDKGLSDEATFIWNTPGTYRINLTVSNESGSTSQIFNVVITELPEPPLAVTISGATAGLVNRPYTFTATTSPITTTQPLNYVWQANGQAQQSHLGEIINDAATFTWDKEGVYAITVTVRNGAGIVTGTAWLSITTVAKPPLQVVIDGLEAGETRTDYVFTATVSPDSATQPLTYTWQATDQSEQVQTNYLTDFISFNWDTPGEKTITVIAANDAAQVMNTFSIVLKAKKFIVRLPIILKGYTPAVTPSPTGQTPAPTTPIPTPTATAKTPIPTTPTATPQTPVPATPTSTPTFAVPVTPSTPTATSPLPATATPTATQVPKLPDLVVTEFTITAIGDGTYKVRVTASNQSAYAVGYGNNFWVGVYTDEIRPGTSPSITWGMQGTWFGAGQSRTSEKIVTAAELGGSGTHTYTAWADVWNYIPEANEGNNVNVLSNIVVASISGEIAPQELLPTGPLPTPTNEVGSSK